MLTWVSDHRRIQGNEDVDILPRDIQNSSQLFTNQQLKSHHVLIGSILRSDKEAL
jgi:hypothetical protein